ncbi:hypothetical protein BD626DRAFT_206086 [Schizophyllum amplum]|nr:hypothetical protein BD626DRAFT_206086 [Auriculariopsis ampla]
MIGALCIRSQIRWHDDPGMQYFHIFAAHAATRCSPASLVDLYLEWSTVTPHALRVDHLRSFAAHTRLVRIYYVHVSSVTELEDEGMGELALWWPAIEELRIMGRDVSRTGCSLRALERFAMHCPRLRALALPLAGRDVPDVEGDAPESEADGDGTRTRPRCALRWITVCGERAPSPDRVAAYLHSLFPSLVSVRDYAGDQTWEKEWKAVTRYLPRPVKGVHG